MRDALRQFQVATGNRLSRRSGACLISLLSFDHKDHLHTRTDYLSRDIIDTDTGNRVYTVYIDATFRRVMRENKH